VKRSRVLAAVAIAAVTVPALAGTGTNAPDLPSAATLNGAKAIDSDASAPVSTPVVKLHRVRANPAAAGITHSNVWSPALAEIAVAHGSTKLENGTAQVPRYGYLGDGPMVPLPGSTAEATKTEPDKNTYLVIRGQQGADPHYSYGRHFLYQGHEGGAGYITRINLDADQQHRVTLMATSDVSGNQLPEFDGSTYDPWAKRLLFTAELDTSGGVWSATLGVPSHVVDISGALGRGGYEGVQNDSSGNIWLIEDVGGAAGANHPNAKQPNSFVYRFVPEQPGDLTHGRLQALQVSSNKTHRPIFFHPYAADADITSRERRALHTYGRTFATRWVTVHDTATDGDVPFDANAAAKDAKATPFKRPENGAFQPGSDFGTFFFTETGDSNLDTGVGAKYGGFGAVYRLRQRSPDARKGRLSMFYRGNPVHTGFDNLAFFGRHDLVVAEDAGDIVHSQRKALDSAYMFDTGADYGDESNQPVRIFAEGRDASATIDSALAAAGILGFQNDGDNEITGIHVSNGDPTVHGILGAQIPRPFMPQSDWLVFYTAQHGDNITYLVVANPLGS
jgi:hypothetical protein